jgi:hypothetical protein
MFWLLVLEQLIDFLKCQAFSLDPESKLHVSHDSSRRTDITHDKEECHDIPAGVDDVHSPADCCQPNRHDVDQDKTASVSFVLDLILWK